MDNTWKFVSLAHTQMITVSEACYCWLVITLYLCAWCPPPTYVLMVVGAEQLSLHTCNTNGLVDPHTNTCTQIKSATPTPIELCSVPVPN